MKRKEILQRIIAKQEEVIHNLEKSTGQYKRAADIDETNTIDPEDLSHQAESKEMQFMMEEQLLQAQQTLSRLQDFEGTSHEVVEPGAVIETADRCFFVGVAFHTISVGKEEIVGLSEEAPLYAELAGKTTGDTFMLGKQEVEILGVY